MKRLSGWLKKYFIPHEHNDFKPHFLRHESALFVFLIVIIIELAFLAQIFFVFDKTNFLAAVLPGVLTSLTNEERAQNNATPLTQNDLLTKAAQMKAQDMATRGYFAHISPDGKTPWYWFEQVGYRYSMAGENLAVNFFESNDVAQAWMDSPSHRANIIKKNYTEIGIGIANGIYEGRNTVFVAQLFGTPIKIPNPPTAPAKPVTPSVTPAPPKITPPIATVAPTPAPTVIQVLGEETNSSINKVLTSPRDSVTYVYGGILLLVIFALLLVFFIRFEMAHPPIIARGVALMAVIFFLLFINTKVLHLDTKVAPEGLSASVIAY